MILIYSFRHVIEDSRESVEGGDVTEGSERGSLRRRHPEVDDK